MEKENEMETKENEMEIKENEMEIKENEIPENAEIEPIEEVNVVQEERAVEVEEGKDWRDSVYGNIKMSVKTLDIVIGAMVGFIVLVLVVGAIKNFL